MQKSNRANAKSNGNGKAVGRSGQSINPAAVAAAYSKNQKSREPQIKGSAKSTRIRHRELIGSVTGSVAFAAFNSYNINPGLAATFPWLSGQAEGWEQYRFHKLLFEYITRAPTSATGSVVLSPDYDALDAAPASEIAAMSYRDASEDAPWKDQRVVLDPSAMFPMGPRKYIRSGAVAGDLKTYDGGVLHVSTNGQAGTDGIGKLFVEYDVELFVPQTESAASASSNSTVSMWNLSANNAIATTVAEIIPFDEEIVNGLNITNTAGVFSLPAGNYEVHVNTGLLNDGAMSAAQQQLLVDGAAMSPPVKALGSQDTYKYTYLPLVAFVTSDGSTTVSVESLVTSSGTINQLGDCCRIFFKIL